jgi:hypothetical protein
MESTFKNSLLSFTEGVEFDEETLDGRKCKSTIVRDGDDKLVQVQRDSSTGAVATTITRELKDGKFVQVIFIYCSFYIKYDCLKNL